MAKKHSKAESKNDLPRQERGGLFNPFAALGEQLSSREQAGDKKSSTAQGATGKHGTGAAGSGQSGKNTARQYEKPGQSGKSMKSGKVAPNTPDTSDHEDAALFMRTVGSPGFRPIKKDSGTKRKPENTARRQQAPEELSMAELLEMQERHSNQPARPDDGAKNSAPAAPGAAFAASQSDGERLFASTASPADEAGAKGAKRTFSPEEEHLFAQAMHGVAPVDGKGRDLPLKREENKTAPTANPPYLDDFLQGKFEFALEYTDEFFEGHVMGVDPLILAKLRSGQYSPESHVDLHGQNSEQAYESLVTFIRHAYGKGQRSLIVVTGRGKNSPGGLSILRQNMQDWLTQEPLKRVVLAFCTAQPKDGGTGAIYVLLRKYKKSSGKIRWDKSGWGGVGVL
ncbi:Smr/MutS family endonuclease [Desulfovibrio sp. OttesenSCG-928-C06]|nr:Smr/MutS family endonuclease [Desulfovibrio sp. OttesenSCG-928-C06]